MAAVKRAATLAFLLSCLGVACSSGPVDCVGSPVDGANQMRIPLGDQEAVGVVQGSYPPRTGDNLKVVWVFAGDEEPNVTLFDPNGEERELTHGPRRHSASSLSVKGYEYGTSYSFTKEGCWNIRLELGDDSADVPVEVL